MDAYLAVTSKRDLGRYADREIPDEVVTQILEAGRVTGSAMNRQPWTFYVIEDRELLDQVAETVFEPSNLQSARLAIAVVVSGKGPLAFDAGRASQNMMLAAWNEGVASSPNGLSDPDRLAALLELGDDKKVQIVLSLGYPARPRRPEDRTPEDWVERANRRPLEEVTRRL